MDDQIGAPPPLQQSMPPAAGRQGPRAGAARRRLMVFGLLLLAVAGGAAAWWTMRRPPGAHYLTQAATRGTVVRAVTATGTVNPELTIIVGSYVSGVIQKLFCDYNTEVKAGQICAKIDPRPYQTVVDQARANLAVAKAQLEKDKANLAYTKISSERYRRLVELDSTSKEAADIAKNAYDQAQAQVDLDQGAIQQRQAELEAAEVNLGYTDIISPVNGTVVSRAVTQGQTVAASFQTPTLFLIATDLTRMQVDTNVSESDVGGIKEGNLATFTVDAFPKRIFKGTVSQVRQSPQTVQNVVTFDAVISVDNSDLALKPGMTASTRIVVDERDDVIRVPNQALRYMPGGPAAMPAGDAAAPPKAATQATPELPARIWVLRNEKPIAVAVTTGLDDDYFTEIVKGDLEPGEAVIIGEERSADSGRPRVPLPRL